VSAPRRVAIVGPGRLGTLLAAACVRGGMAVVAVAGGSDASRERLAARVAGARPIADPVLAARAADLVLLTVPDDAIAAVADALARDDAVAVGQLVVHCSGVHGVAPLRRVELTGAAVAACHPAVSVPIGATDPAMLVGTAWAVTLPGGAGVEAREAVHELVRRLGGDPHDVAEQDRVLYHAALTVGANALGAAVVTARRLLAAARVHDARAFLAPLVDSAVTATLAAGAAGMTGPVARGDVGTVARHLEALALDAPELLEAYRSLTRATLAAVRPALPPDAVSAFDALLDVSSGPGEDPEVRPRPAVEGGA
jgi:predicted short-subunit dehydrogenase-like oxidoreductase (DUF2520 family)